MGNNCFPPGPYKKPQRCPKNTLNLLRHDNVIDHIQDMLIYLRNGNLYIVDISNSPKHCVVCGPVCPNKIRLYCFVKWEDVSGSYDGVTRLPTITAKLDLRCFISIEHFNIPNFGTLLVKGNCIVYNPYKKIDKMQSSSLSSSTFMIDGELAVSCQTFNYEPILVNMDGKIIDMETTYYTGFGINITINTPYGDFSAIKDQYAYDYRDWTFTGTVPAPKIRNLRTKPASREIDYS